MDNMYWFQSLNKPLLSPPDWLFTPVWTVLYIMMGISLILFAQGGITRNKQFAAILFTTQLILNLLWPATFFGNMNIFGGLIIIILLDFILAATILAFYKHSKIAAILLVPYFLWVLFATYLNLQYYLLN